MGKMRGSQSQFEIIIDYMERNGDLCRLPQGAQGRLESLQKWTELTELLNNNSKGEAKPLEKWRKTWSDFKNNTKKKIEKLKKQGEGTELTEVEKRVLKLIGNKKRRRRGASHLESEENGVMFKEEMDTDSCQKSLTPPQRYFCAVEPQSSGRRNSSASSCSSLSSSSSQPPEKRKKSNKNEKLKEITDRFLEFEREREKMAHEREMARIKQNEQFIAIFGRIVNVLETLSPSIQRYLDRNNNGDG